MIYLGDCREILSGIVADVLVTDPPYGMQWKSGRGGIRGDAAVRGDESTALRDYVLSWWGNDRAAVVFGTWKIPRPPGVRCLLVWDKGVHVGSGDLTMPWKPNTEEVYILGSGFHGLRSSSVLVYNAPSPNFVGLRCHPTEKPVPLMHDLIGKCPDGVVLDLFMGSGTTLRAAKDLGRRAIGIEIEERYCEIAAKRLAQDVLL